MALRVESDEQEAWRQTVLRSHPCRQLLTQIAGGYKPTGQELAELIEMAAPADRDRVRSRLAQVTAELHQLRNDGALGAARQLAREVSFELAPVLGPHRAPAEDLSALTPSELAFRISRGPGAIGPPAR